MVDSPTNIFLLIREDIKKVDDRINELVAKINDVTGAATNVNKVSNTVEHLATVADDVLKTLKPI